jgi:hypothetical protein
VAEEGDGSREFKHMEFFVFFVFLLLIKFY